MRIDSSLLERKSQQPQKQQQQQLRELPKEKSRGKKNRKRNKKQMPPSVIQNLYDTCKEVFAGAGTIPSPVDVERLRSVLDSMSPEDVGLSQDMLYFRTTETERAPLITYLHLYECDKFSMGIFCLPPSVQPSGVRLAKVKIDTVFTAPCNTSILYPAAGGNMHCFTAMTACAVLDVLGPPYSDSEGRHCTYYNSFPYASFSGDADGTVEDGGEEYAWLEEREEPEDVHVVGAKYRGPRITEH